MRRPSLPFASGDDQAASRAAGIWSLGEDGLIEIERFDIGPAIILVPTERLLLLTANLPVQGRRARRAALPFAIEDRIAAPLTAVHVALGAELMPQHHLAAVAADDLMREWVVLIDAAGFGHAALVPDVLALPVPAAGSWSVDATATRALVRTNDGAGFAIPMNHLETAWRLAGEPAVTAYGIALPFALATDVSDIALEPLAARLAAPAIDLRQGAFAGQRTSATPLLRRVLTIAAIGLIAHGAIAAADMIALERIVAARESETRSLITKVAPTAVIGSDLATSAADLLPQNGAGPSSFLPLLSRVTTALQPLGATITMRSIAFDAANTTLSIEVEAADIAGLQKVGAALTGGGLSAQAGAASQDQGKAVGAFLIRGAA